MAEAAESAPVGEAPAAQEAHTAATAPPATSAAASASAAAAAAAAADPAAEANNSSASASASATASAPASAAPAAAKGEGEAPPSLESDHQEERIRARRLRIAQRQEAARRAAEGREEEAGAPKGDPALDPEPQRSNSRIAESHQVRRPPGRLGGGASSALCRCFPLTLPPSPRERKKEGVGVWRHSDVATKRDGVWELLLLIAESAVSKHSAPHDCHRPF